MGYVQTGISSAREKSPSNSRARWVTRSMKLFTADTASVDDRRIGGREVPARRCLRKAAVVAFALLSGACQPGLSGPPAAEQSPSLAVRPRAAVNPLPPANLQS